MPFYCSHCTPFLFYLLPLLPLQPLSYFVCVWCLTGAWFWCFAAAVLTFLEAWPAFHICAGQRVLFALTIMGDPQLLFRTFKEPLKCLCWRGKLCCTEKTWASGEVSLESGSVRLQSSSAVTGWFYSSEALDAQATCTYKTACFHESHGSVCVCSKHTVVLSKPRLLYTQMFFQTLYTHTAGANVSETYLYSFIVFQQNVASLVWDCCEPVLTKT